MSVDIDPDRWYWDRRTKKAYYPRAMGDGTVEFVTIWHAGEVSDALDGGALVPLSEVGLDRTETPFDLMESFRTQINGETDGDAGEADRLSGRED